ncbi:MAG: sugar transferase, partial [Panacagrimonas sp.]
AIASWVRVQAVLLLFLYLSGLLQAFPPALLLSWWLLTPAALLLLNTAVTAASVRIAELQPRARTAVMVFAGAVSADLTRKLRDAGRHELVGFFDDQPNARTDGVSYLGKLEDLPGYLRDHRIDAVFVILPGEGGLRPLDFIDLLDEIGVSIYFVLDPLLLNLLSGRLREVSGAQILELPKSRFYTVDGVVKRTLDVVLASGLLFLLLPLFVLLAPLVRISSRGSVFVTQTGFDLSGRAVSALRFRVLQPDGVHFTAIGRWLRRTSIEDLPLLMNVLRGEMSLVGPRMEPVAHNAHYQRALRRQVIRHRIRPGITGWAQVNGVRGERAQVDRIDDRIRFDLEYIAHWSPIFDLRVLWMTLMILARGARGGHGRQPNR